MPAFAGRRTLTDDIIAHLEAAGLTVGDGDRTDDAGTQLALPCVVVHPAGGAPLDGTLANPREDAESAVQVDSVGSTRRQAEWAFDEARAAMFSGLSVTGRTVQWVENGLQQGVQRDDSVEPSVWRGVERYHVKTTPTT